LEDIAKRSWYEMTPTQQKLRIRIRFWGADQAKIRWYHHRRKATAGFAATDAIDSSDRLRMFMIEILNEKHPVKTACRSDSPVYR
jgi:hypothetical protein